MLRTTIGRKASLRITNTPNSALRWHMGRMKQVAKRAAVGNARQAAGRTQPVRTPDIAQESGRTTASAGIFHAKAIVTSAISACSVIASSSTGLMKLVNTSSFLV